MYLISYDISEDRIRNKVAKELENYGKRVQYSVFECVIDKKKYKELQRKMTKLMQKEDIGNIRVYEICENCREKLYVIGKVPDGELEVVKKGEVVII